MATPEIGQMAGCSVIDPDAQKVGTVKDVVYDDRTMEMRWAVVEYGHGLTHHRTLVPALMLYKAEDGNVATMLHNVYIKWAQRRHGVVQLTTVCDQSYGRERY